MRTSAAIVKMSGGGQAVAAVVSTAANDCDRGINLWCLIISTAISAAARAAFSMRRMPGMWNSSIERRSISRRSSRVSRSIRIWHVYRVPQKCDFLISVYLTNDDGESWRIAAGILALYRELVKLGEVTVIAPEQVQSATGHGITLTARCLRVRSRSRTRLPGSPWTGDRRIV